MLLYVLNILSVALFGLSSAGKTTIPVITCKRDSVDYSTCLKQTLEEIWSLFIKGLPEYDMPHLDPLFHKYGKYTLNAGDIYATIILSNITLSGLSKLQFIDVRPLFLDDTFRLQMDVQVPRIFINGIVNVDGGLYAFRIITEGFFNVTTSDVSGLIDIMGHVVNDTWIVKQFRLLPSFKEVKVYYDNFNQNTKGFSDIVVAFVNEFWPSLYRILMPIASDKWAPLWTNYSNIFFSKVPFSKLFP